MLIPPNINTAPSNSPGGFGYALITNYPGTLRNPAAATARITGALADGTAFNQTVPVAQDGSVPIYANLYAGKGLLLGWINLNLTNTNTVTVTGLTWIHPARLTGTYPDGFTNILLTNEILLSPWTNPPANLGFLTNLFLLNTIDFTNTPIPVTITSGKVTGTSTTPVNGSVNLKTGLLTVTITSGTFKVTGHGAILLNSNDYGGGYLLNGPTDIAITLTR